MNRRGFITSALALAVAAKFRRKDPPELVPRFHSRTYAMAMPTAPALWSGVRFVGKGQDFATVTEALAGAAAGASIVVLAGHSETITGSLPATGVSVIGLSRMNRPTLRWSA